MTVHAFIKWGLNNCTEPKTALYWFQLSAIKSNHFLFCKTAGILNSTIPVVTFPWGQSIHDQVRAFNCTVFASVGSLISPFLSFQHSRYAWIHNPYVMFWCVSFWMTAWDENEEQIWHLKNEAKHFFFFFYLWCPSVQAKGGQLHSHVKKWNIWLIHMQSKMFPVFTVLPLRLASSEWTTTLLRSHGCFLLCHLW